MTSTSAYHAPFVQQVSFQEGRSDKFYRVYVIANREDDSDNRVVCQWGRRGSRGSQKVDLFDSLLAAEYAAHRKIDSKVAKGYSEGLPGDGRRTLEKLSQDLLDIAGIHVPTSVATPEIDRTAVFVEFAAEVDRCRRLAFGTPEEQAQAIGVRNSLTDQLNFLRGEVIKAEGQLDFVQDIIHMALEGASV